MEQLRTYLPPRGGEVTKLSDTGLSLRGYGVGGEVTKDWSEPILTVSYNSPDGKL
jgi:hypothetical protein